MGALKICSTCKHYEVLVWDEPCGECYCESNWTSNKEEDKVNTFKIGDLITGINGSEYGITNDNAICKVIEIYGGNSIRVELVETTDEDYKFREGRHYTVNSKYFKLTTLVPSKTNMINLAFVKFSMSNKLYLFTVPENTELIHGELVICDTTVGESIGEIINGSFVLPEKIYIVMVKEMRLNPKAMKSIIGVAERRMFDER